ncbi:sugar transport protein 5-like [Miscanthus floridulus]|uniref:sugar transport protein 5-like n=1 Tax=Miscanthus floridulus TaxID=154761 RepID=UPI0034592D35
MLIGGMFFLAGAILNTSAVHISMLIIGRILLAFAVAASPAWCIVTVVCWLQSAPVYLAEIAPARWRGAFTTCFNVGMFMADMVNYGTNSIVPAAVVIVGAALIPDTPNSLVLRGRLDEAPASLRRIREDGAAADTDAELKDIVRAMEQDRRHESGARG